MATAEKKKLLNARQAAEFLDLAQQTLACWRMDGRHLPFIKVGRSVRYRLTDLEKFLDTRTVPAAS